MWASLDPFGESVAPLCQADCLHPIHPRMNPMPASAKRVATKRPAKSKSRAATGLWGLPEWNLADLYAGIEDPRIARDLDQADAESLAFEETYKGKLAGLAEGPQ